FQNLIGLSVVAGGKEVRSLTKRHLIEVGFSEDEKVVPYSKRSFSGARLLVEYLHFPEKFMFFDITELGLSELALGEQAELYFYFDTNDDWL
ncbi:type VI secretion system baseplate subunit TssF, partial [Vibrio diabolicus]